MQFKNQKKFSDLAFAVMLLFFTITSILVVNSIGKKQDGRSQAAVNMQETGSGTGIRCPIGDYINDMYKPGYAFCYDAPDPDEIMTCGIDGTWKKTPCEYGCKIGKKVCNSNPNTECTKGQQKCSDDLWGVHYCDNGKWSDEYDYCVGGCNSKTNDCYMCTPGTGRCVQNDKSKRQVCTEDSLWSSPKPCGTGKECQSGECVKITWVKLTGINVNPVRKSLKIGQSFKIDTTFVPTNTTEKLIGWKTSNSSVASVDMNGTVVAKGLGKAVITVYSRPNRSIFKAVEVTVANAPTYSLSLKPTVLTLGVDEFASIQPTLTPTRSSEVLTWKSSDESVANVYIPACSNTYIDRCVTSNYYLDKNVKKCTKCSGIRQAIILGLKKGTATITVTASPSGTKTTIEVTVR